MNDYWFYIENTLLDILLWIGGVLGVIWIALLIYITQSED